MSNKIIRGFFLLVIIFLNISELQSKMSTNTITGWNKIERALENNQNVFLFFSDGKSKSCEEMRSVLNDIEKELDGKVTVIEILIADLKEEELIKFFKVRETPLILIIAPNRLVVNRFVNVVSKSLLMNSLISPATAALTKASRKGRPAVLYFYKNDAPHRKATDAMLDDSTKHFIRLLEVVKVDVADKEEKKLQERFKIVKTPTILVINSNGVVMERFEGAVEKDEFIKSLWRVWLSGDSSCSPNPRCKGCP